MRSQNPNGRPLQLVSVGLLLITLPFLLREYFYISDFFRGLFAGLGIAMEIGGIVWMGRLKRAV